MSNQRIAVPGPAIMDPFSVAPRLDQAGAFEMSQVSRDFRLHYPECIGQLANACLAACEQIQQPQPCRIRQDFKEDRRFSISL